VRSKPPSALWHAGGFGLPLPADSTLAWRTLG